MTRDAGASLDQRRESRIDLAFCPAPDDDKFSPERLCGFLRHFSLRVTPGPIDCLGARA